MSTTVYSTAPWRDLRSRILANDAECVFARLAGNCLGAIQLHHIEPIADGGPLIPDEDGVVPVCTRHHSMLHGFINRGRKWRTCPHQHRTREARELCETRLNS